MLCEAIDHLVTMDFAHRLAAARKHVGLTQQALADRIGTHVIQIRRYEAGTSVPTPDVLRYIPIGFSVIDSVFDEHERGPRDDVALAIEAAHDLTAHEAATVRELLEAMLLKHEARRWTDRARF